ncbi:MAG: hypothetical protein GY765_30350 [bacterium]|nr:hypothetical protein [bacterium]
MKNSIIGFLVVCLMVTLSFFYKFSRKPVLDRFPVMGISNRESPDEPSLYLYLFFSKHNCSECMESIEVLNQLPEKFVVIGIVPPVEFQEQKELRLVTGASFKLVGLEGRYEAFVPYYAPTLYGVSGTGKILFVLPGVPDEKEYLQDFLVNFYRKRLDILRRDGE